MCYVRRDEKRTKVLEDVQSGKRLLGLCSGARELLLGLCKPWVVDRLDPTGKVRQQQFPLLIGCSTELQRDMCACDPLTGLTESRSIYTLFLSCMTQLEIPFEVFRQPIFKAWSSDMLPIAHILLSAIAGAQLFEGGLEGVPPGGIKGTEDAAKFKEARLQLAEGYVEACNSAWADEIQEEREALVNKISKQGMRGTVLNPSQTAWLHYNMQEVWDSVLAEKTSK